MELWHKAKGLLLPFDGMASQLYVLDLPLSSLGTTLDKLSEESTNLQLVTLDAKDVNRTPLTRSVRDELVSRSQNATYHRFETEWAAAKSLSIWLWVDTVKKTFDFEIVFWADILFPNPDDELACNEIFVSLISFAEAIRTINPKSECVLSTSEIGDPRGDRDKGWSLTW